MSESGVSDECEDDDEARNSGDNDNCSVSEAAAEAEENLGSETGMPSF